VNGWTWFRFGVVMGALLWVTQLVSSNRHRRDALAAQVPHPSKVHMESSPLDSRRACFEEAQEAPGMEHDAGRGSSVMRRKTRSLAELAGSIKSPLSGLSVDEMNPWRGGPTLAWLMRLAGQVWADKAEASAWMSSPHLELDGSTPIEAAMTTAGAERVEAILWRILYGIPT
jgi:hypothetical protein